MIKHIIAGISTILAIWACIYMYDLDKEVNKVQNIAEIIEKSAIAVQITNRNAIEKEMISTGEKNTSTSNTLKSDNKENKELKALKSSSGDIATFKVSILYTRHCSSCHGSIGQGIIGPKIIGRSKDFILKNLNDFKSGVKKNYVMYGLLQNLSNEQLIKLSIEIASFQSKLDAANK